MGAFNCLPYDQLKANVQKLLLPVKEKHEATKSDISESRMARKKQVALIETTIELLDCIISSYGPAPATHYKNHFDQTFDVNDSDRNNEFYTQLASLILTGTLLLVKNEIKQEYSYEKSNFAVSFFMKAVSSIKISDLYSGIDAALGASENNKLDDEFIEFTTSLATKNKTLIEASQALYKLQQIEAETKVNRAHMTKQVLPLCNFNNKCTLTKVDRKDEIQGKIAREIDELRALRR